MPKICLFAEDYGHEAFLIPLCRRLAAEYGVEVEIRPLSVRGGFGKVEQELEQFIQGVLRYREPLPDLMIVATDANCRAILSGGSGCSKLLRR